MAIERTLSIVKPDAVSKDIIGKIYSRLETAGLRIVAAKMIHMDNTKAGGFYAEHEGKPFYEALVEFMTSGPVMVQVLEGENAIKHYREVMGATDPAEAADDTIRKVYAESKSRNAVHGSDSPASAEREIAYFFNADEICPR
ncbi:nucleoside-diphosphate kinase [Agaribacterium haliotis]|uniref:nucleoside-diphosphate kinase n=1 Tax=Agaribacterium haliotis TaxID=2013869 RepID=UPI000BB5487E|nr:nucleoside-diphosphate kinase [Agaribacterium haliotis]